VQGTYKGYMTLITLASVYLSLLGKSWYVSLSLRRIVSITRSVFTVRQYVFALKIQENFPLEGGY
jgi:hypothetical protein